MGPVHDMRPWGGWMLLLEILLPGNLSPIDDAPPIVWRCSSWSVPCEWSAFTTPGRPFPAVSYFFCIETNESAS